MRTRILIEALAFVLLAALYAPVGPAVAQTPAQPANAGPIQPWGLPPLPSGVGPVEKFADIKDTPQAKFLEGVREMARQAWFPFARKELLRLAASFEYRARNLGRY